jgi:tRNA1Val (adenine37-N6)-methyltransferase
MHEFMSSSTFEFKQFKIKQDKCAMKVSTDAVLIGAWATFDNPKKILDIGTGTGVIALMLAQRYNAHIDAIDIDESACIQARENVKASKWNNNINVFHISLQNFSKQSEHQYDLIVSNPPYFIDSSKAPHEARNIARHTDELPYIEMIQSVLLLLNKKGKFCVILPHKEGNMFRELADKRGLKCSKITHVKTKKEKEEKRLMMQFELESKLLIQDEIVIELEKRHSYTEEYKNLTKDYYLAF